MQSSPQRGEGIKYFGGVLGRLVLNNVKPNSIQSRLVGLRLTASAPTYKYCYAASARKLHLDSLGSSN